MSEVNNSESRSPSSSAVASRRLGWLARLGATERTQLGSQMTTSGLEYTFMGRKAGRRVGLPAGGLYFAQRVVLVHRIDLSNRSLLQPARCICPLCCDDSLTLLATVCDASAWPPTSGALECPKGRTLEAPGAPRATAARLSLFGPAVSRRPGKP